MEHGSRGIAELMFNDCRCTTIYEIPAVKKHAIRNGIKLSVTSIKIIDAPVKVEAVATDLPSWSEGTGDRSAIGTWEDPGGIEKGGHPRNANNVCSLQLAKHL